MEVTSPKVFIVPRKVEIYGEDLDTLIKTNKFVPDKEFSGTDRAGGLSSSGPVQFEKDKEDPQFLTIK